MKSHVSKLFLREIEKEFNRFYPYVRIEFPRNGGAPPESRSSDSGGQALGESARELLLEEARLADGMTVRELESALMILLALPVQIFRKSGKMWIETKMTGDWTLKQQNDRGRELAPGEEA